MTELLEVVSKIRKRRSVNLITLGSLLGVSQGYITLILHGKRSVPNDFFSKMRDKLGLDMEEQQELLEAINLHPLMSEEKIKKDRIQSFFKEMLKMANEIFAKAMLNAEIDKSLLSRLIDFLQNLDKKINNTNEVSMI